MAMTVRRTRGGRIVNQPDTNGFEVLPKRRLVERAFARISRNRCRARDFEHYATAAAAFGRLAMIRINLRKAAHRTLSERSSSRFYNSCRHFADDVRRFLITAQAQKDRVAHFAAGCPLGEFYFAHEPGL